MRAATAMEYQTKLWIGESSSELGNNFRALIKVGQYWTMQAQKYTYFSLFKN
jgi:hypothetical protein